MNAKRVSTYTEKICSHKQSLDISRNITHKTRTKRQGAK